MLGYGGYLKGWRLSPRCRGPLKVTRLGRRNVALWHRRGQDWQRGVWLKRLDRAIARAMERDGIGCGQIRKRAALAAAEQEEG